MRKSFYLIIISVFLFSCKKKETSFEVVSFNSVTNKEFQANDSIVFIEADLSDAPLYGIRIPNAKQCDGGKLSFDFKIKRTDAKREKLYYRLFYQNETYKFDESHEYSGENFYGSWEDHSNTFKPVPDFDNEISITDSLVIIGNPRNEQIYFGLSPANKIVDNELLYNTMNYIKSDPVWFADIQKKARLEKRTIEEQLRMDALWSIDDKRKKEGSVNNRMWRNPRMGKYEFMLVVVSESKLKELPYYTKQINYPDINGRFVNPFAYYKLGKGSKPDDILCVMGNKKVKTKAKFDLGAGLFVDNKLVGRENFNKDSYSNTCGESFHLYRYAHFQQYFHYINKDFPLKNISEVKDVMDPTFTREQYEAYKKQYEASNKFVDTYVNSSDCPCKTVKSDSVEKTITLVNPGNKEGDYKKEHVGVAGRIGFTYGKWRAKIKFPELINKHNVWNGLTNAFWLLAQETGSQWNQRRECRAKIGYIPKTEPDNETALQHSKKRDGYSEIDFEILKESQYWPMTSYPGKKNGPKEDASASDDITVTCTNWDLACHEPEKFDIGARKNIIEEMEFTHHRWDQWYKALTTKVPAKHKEVFGGEYYYFEIDWQPKKIVWRIGPSKDNMRIVCIMDETVSAIPNNQMVALVTQEWHSQEWWPTAPFKQNFVPFPKKDIIGKILEIEVE
ncbi:MAG: hypothetical protein Q8M29_11205 [Bacteroidota bacterium]|nr:hypothetical protein [Bacteroidota bacterium]